MNGISRFIGSTICALAVLVAASQASAQNLITNPGFELAGANSSLAANWTTDTAAGGPVYGVRTNDNPHSGSFNYEIHLASTGAGPVVQFNQSGIGVTAGTAYNFSFFSDKLAGANIGDVEEYNVQWFNASSGFISQTGYTSFTPGANVYAQSVITNNLTAPVGAVTATVFLHAAGGAIVGGSATIDFDDVSFAAVPEPTTVALVGIGLFGAIALGRKRKS
jgi:hypothetical protein